ncbi:MAG: ImmA/IrrE family metallo-endopeptidase [Lewinellaceae bacterium]|nr:ImmA/IrrE family metallo-endopeptidase [Saprospiraceae bacterium]MCB9341791.1 ImmA/IrrE family metallo-endopeptidase [Lewinellaceae bacterium]
MQNFPARLKSARLMNGMSIQDLVNRLDNSISKQAISRYENGIMQPSGENLSLLCKALKVKPDYFERESSVELKELSYRKLKRLSAKEQERVREVAIDHLERYLELENLMGESSPPKISLEQYEVKTFEDVERAAEDFRAKMGFGDDPLLNLVERLEEEGIKVVEIKADPDFSGFATVMNGEFPVVVLNVHPDIPLDRKRFTLAHELGHLLLKPIGLDEEKACNRFSGAMLIPQNRMREELLEKRHNIHVKELMLLKQQYGMSMQAILYRAKDLGIITDYLFTQQMRFFSQMGMRKQEPGVIPGEEHSHRFLQLLLRGIAEEIISTSKAAALYNMKLADFMDELTKLN